MKKKLLFAFLLLSIGAQAQQAFLDNFESYTLGNIGTDLTGATAGQGGWLTTSTNGTAPTTTTNSSSTNFQIVSRSAPYDKVLQITGPNGDLGSRFMAKDLGTFWSTRTTGNNILEIEWFFYTGTASASLNNMRLLVWDAALTKILCGMSINMNTLVLSGVAYYDATTQGGQVNNYLLSLGPAEAPALVLPSETWVLLATSYNLTTGEVRWKSGGGLNVGVPGAAANTAPQILRLQATAGGAANATAAVGLWDNLKVKASATDTLLDLDRVATPTEFSVYPNPVNNTLTVSASAGINQLTVIDINGRQVKSQSVAGLELAEIDLSDLTSGIYFVKVKTASGEEVRKIVKQ
jgi:hypothetical protein